MRKIYSGTAGAVLTALTLLAGCSHHGVDSAAAVAGPGAAVSSTAPSAPPGFSSAPGVAAPATAPPSSPAGGTGTTGGDNTRAGTAHPSRAAGRPVPPIDSIRIGWIQGTVTRGGPGPCFGVKTDGGDAYALYSAQNVKLTTGQRIRARLTPGPTPVDCGAGKPGQLDHVLIGG